MAIAGSDRKECAASPVFGEGRWQRLGREKSYEPPDKPTWMTTETLAPDQHDLCCSNWDLVARSTLPEIQISYTSQQLVESVASALLPMLDAEFAFVSAGQRHGGSSVEAVRTRDPTRSGLDAWTRHSLYEIAAARRTGEPAVIPNPIDENTLRLAMASIGHGDGGILIVASPRSGFPSDVQKPILVMAAEDAYPLVQQHLAARIVDLAAEQLVGPVTHRGRQALSM